MKGCALLQGSWQQVGGWSKGMRRGSKVVLGWWCLDSGKCSHRQCRRAAQCIMECLICQVIEIEPAHSFEPCIEIVVPELIYARLCILVLSSCIESSAKLEDNCDGICVPTR
jgi:hypothetical protein